MVKRKNILKEAGILLFAVLLVLTAIVMVPMTMAQQLPHDVGMKSIDSPVDGFAGGYVPIQVTVKNYGTNTETFDVQVQIIKIQGGTPEYAELEEYLTLDPGDEMIVDFPGWTPSDWGSSAYECLDVTYNVTAFTILEGDGDPDNNVKFKDITLCLDSIPPIKLFFISIFGGRINIGVFKDTCSGLDRVEWFQGTPSTPWVPNTLLSLVNQWELFWRCAFFSPPALPVTIKVYDKAGNWLNS